MFIVLSIKYFLINYVSMGFILSWIMLLSLTLQIGCSKYKYCKDGKHLKDDLTVNLSNIKALKGHLLLIICVIDFPIMYADDTSILNMGD
jgi:hypothetical protein